MLRKPIRVVQCLGLSLALSVLVISLATILDASVSERPAAPAANSPGPNGLDVDSKYQKTCIDSECHPVDIRGHIPKHSPYLEGECLTCHIDHATSSPNLLRGDVQIVCLDCHKDLELAEGTSRAQHPPDTERCLDCHAPHESRLRNLVRKPEQLHACFDCHEDFFQEMEKHPYRHHYFDPQEECGMCHYAHRNSKEHYLRENVGDTCMTCHSLPIRLPGRVIADVKSQVRAWPHVHPPVAEHKCATCHTPHGSPQPSLLSSGYPGGNYDSYERDQYQLCWNCHDPAIVERRWTRKATQFRQGDQNLHYIHVVKLGRGRACHLCHLAHASHKPHLLSEELKFREWKTELKINITPNGAGCATPCHLEKAYDRSAPDMMRVLSKDQ